MIPYDWRPGQLWYKLKCFFIRYTTIKPRYLKHTWCDRCELLSHMIFEIFSDFIENECSPGIVDWSDVKIGDKFIRDEMQELYDWWHNVYNKYYLNEYNHIWAEIKKHMPVRDWVDFDGDMVEYKPVWKTKEDEEIYKNGFNKISKLEDKMAKELKQNLHRIIELRPYLWT